MIIRESILLVMYTHTKFLVHSGVTISTSKTPINCSYKHHLDSAMSRKVIYSWLEMSIVHVGRTLVQYSNEGFTRLNNQTRTNLSYRRDFSHQLVESPLYVRDEHNQLKLLVSPSSNQTSGSPASKPSIISRYWRTVESLNEYRTQHLLSIFSDTYAQIYHQRH